MTLTLQEQTILYILAVNIDYLPVQTIMICLDRLGIKTDKGSKFTQKAIKPLITSLRKKELVKRIGTKVRCVDEAVQAVLEAALEDGEFNTIAAMVRELQPAKTLSIPVRSLRGKFLSERQARRECYITLFTATKSLDIHQLVHKTQYGLPSGDPSDDHLYSLFNEPFSPELLNHLHPNNQAGVLEYIVQIISFKMIKGEEAIDQLLALFLDGKYGNLSPASLLALLLVRLRLDDARKVLQKIEKDPGKVPHVPPIYNGWLEFLCGNNDKALNLFDQGMKILRKTTGKRTLFIRAYAGLVFFLAMLKADDEKWQLQALKYLDIIVRKRETGYQLSLADQFRTVFLERLDQPVQRNWEPVLYMFSGSPPEKLLYYLILWWVDKKAAKKNSGHVITLKEEAAAGGYNWIAAEAAELLAVMGNKPTENRKFAARLKTPHQIEPLVNIISPREEWQKTLQSLIKLQTPEQDAALTEAKGERLIWLVKYFPAYHSATFTPRLQNLGKSGKWTKGRPVALKTLYEKHKSMPGLSEQDLRACAAIDAVRSRNYGYYPTTEYRFDWDNFLPAMVGHPLLFLTSSPTTRVELVEGEPELRLEKVKNDLKISLNPSPVQGRDSQVVISQETPTRFKVVRFKQNHLRVAELVGAELSVPKAGFDLAARAAASLSSSLTVLSDLGEVAGQAEETVAGDTTPHMHLVPHGEGLKLEILVKPLAQSESWFKPGQGGRNVLVTVDHKKIQAERNLEQEREFAQKVVEACPALAGHDILAGETAVDDPQDCLQLLLELKECPEKVALEWPMGETLKVRHEVSFDKLSLSIKKDRDWFKASGSLRLDEDLVIDLQEVLAMLDKSMDRFVPLDDGTFVALTHEFQKRLEELRDYSHKSGKGARFNPLAALALEDLFNECEDLQADKAWREHVAGLNEVVDAPLPSTLQAELRDYQLVGFKWLAQLSHWKIGACLADDMGLGKTLQALAAILTRAEHGPTLVVAPLSVMSNWRDEATRFAPTLNMIQFGPGNRQKMLDNLQSFDVVVCSYGLLQTEEAMLAEVQWQTVVLDEVQAIKNANTKRARAATKLQSVWKIITTGTPLENHLSDVWSLFHFLNPGLLGTKKQFLEKYAIPIERDHNKQVQARLRKLLRPFILRRLKSEVLMELPPRTDITLQVEMSKEEAALYEAQRIKALQDIEKAADEGQAGSNHLRILAEIMKLRRLCCNPKLLLPDTRIPSSKLAIFGETLEELLANKHKTLVFSQFVDHLNILRKHLEEKGIAYQYLDGSTPAKARQERITAFQSGQGDVFLISLKAGGTGLNLTAADYVIHMDPWWNPAVEDQASDRAHRIGQKRPVTVYRLVMKGSIEEQIVDLHRQKRDLAAGLLEGSDMAGKVSTEELLELLRG